MPDGRERSRSFGRRVDAERWLTDELARIDRGEWVDPDLGRIGWTDYSELLMESRVHLSARTRETDRRCHERARETLVQVPLSRITPDLIRRLMAELAAVGYAPETIAKTMRWVRLTLNQAVTDRRILVSPSSADRRRLHGAQIR